MGLPQPHKEGKVPKEGKAILLAPSRYEGGRGGEYWKRERGEEGGRGGRCPPSLACPSLLNLPLC